jgi:hypothetical protein
MIKKRILLAILLFILASCSSAPTSINDKALQAGFRYSSYGPSHNPGPEYWPYVGEQMSAKFPGSRPAALWIVSIVDGEGTYLNTSCETEDPHIRCGYVDMNDDILDVFDEKGYAVWLQVEPGNASVDELIDIVLDHYKDHSSVVGFGIDVEWYKSTGGPEGQPITDDEAERWVNAIRAHNPGYQLFLKHWDENWMPPTVRDGIMFVNDSQQFESFDQLVDEFTAWGEKFSPSPVGYQFGYPADRVWWQELRDPPKDIGQAILDNTPNAKGLFWVDFTILDVFPPP